MDCLAEAFEKLNRVFQRKIADAGDSTLDEDSKSKLKLEIFEKWKNTLIKHTKECVETIKSSRDALNKSMSDSSDEAPKVTTCRMNASQDYHNFTEQVAALKALILEMGSRSQQALDELSRIAVLFEKQLHLNNSLSKEVVTLKSNIQSMRSKTAYYNELADKILANMKEESIDLKRFFAEYEKRVQSIEMNSTLHSQEMSRRVKTLENELAVKNQKIHELNLTLKQKDRPPAASTPIEPKKDDTSPSKPPKWDSDTEIDTNIHPTSHESLEYNLTDVELSDEEKMRTLENGAKTMAQLLKEKQKMLREYYSTILKLRKKLKRSGENRESIDGIQITLNNVQIEKTKLIQECESLRSKAEQYQALRIQFEQMTNEQKHREENFTRKIASQEQLITELTEKHQRLKKTNLDFFNGITIAYKELGICINKAVK